MRRTTFYIDDGQYWGDLLENVQDRFRAVYILFGENKNMTKYELFYPDGESLSLASLNDYQQNIILAGCQKFFETGGRLPVGCTAILDESKAGTFLHLVIGASKCLVSPHASGYFDSYQVPDGDKTCITIKLKEDDENDGK